MGKKVGRNVGEKTGKKAGESLGEIDKLNLCLCMPQISIAQVIHEVGLCIVLYRVSKTHGHMNACLRTFFLNPCKILIFKRRNCKTCNLSAFWHNLTKKFHI